MAWMRATRSGWPGGVTWAWLDGWVRNLPDGRVEVWLQGDEDAVNEMVDWLWVGPPTASSRSAG